MVYHTSELLAIVDRVVGPVEVVLHLNYGLRATHWFSTGRRTNFYYHEGIDGEYRCVHRKHILAAYPDSDGPIWDTAKEE